MPCWWMAIRQTAFGRRRIAQPRHDPRLRQAQPLRARPARPRPARRPGAQRACRAPPAIPCPRPCRSARSARLRHPARKMPSTCSGFDPDLADQPRLVGVGPRPRTSVSRARIRSPSATGRIALAGHDQDARLVALARPFQRPREQVALRGPAAGPCRMRHRRQRLRIAVGPARAFPARLRPPARAAGASARSGRSPLMPKALAMSRLAVRPGLSAIHCRICSLEGICSMPCLARGAPLKHRRPLSAGRASSQAQRRRAPAPMKRRSEPAPCRDAGCRRRDRPAPPPRTPAARRTPVAWHLRAQLDLRHPRHRAELRHRRPDQRRAQARCRARRPARRPGRSCPSSPSTQQPRRARPGGPDPSASRWIASPSSSSTSSASRHALLLDEHHPAQGAAGGDILGLGRSCDAHAK